MVMLVWLWPVAVGLSGSLSYAVATALLCGLLFDARGQVHFGLTAAVGMIAAYAAGRLGREGIGDLDSAAIWVAPSLAAAAGFFAPILYLVGGVFFLDFDLWRGSVGAMIVVNTVAFFFLARPMIRVARWTVDAGSQARR